MSGPSAEILSASSPLRTVRSTRSPASLGPDHGPFGNNNDDLYLVPSPLLRRVATAWAHWASWLLDQLDLLENSAVHVDQVAMAMALSAETIASVPLDVRWNTPIHDRQGSRQTHPSRRHPLPPGAGPPWSDPSDGAPSIDRQIEVANAAIRKVWTKAVLNPPTENGSHNQSRNRTTS